MENVSTVNQTTGNGGKKDYTKEIVVLTSLFFMWGFLTVLNDILIPHLKAVFELNYTQAMLVQFAFFGAYFIVSIPAGSIIHKFGYKNGIILGLLVAGLGCVLFYPAASFASYPFFLGALFILAGGITILQVAANPYVAILGSPENASSRLNLTQAFNSLGTTLGPIFGSMLIMSATVKSSEELSKLPIAEADAYRALEASTVQLPYLGIAATLVVIALIIARIKLPVIKDENLSEAGENNSEKKGSAWEYSHLVLGAVGIFVYVGGEVSIGSFLPNYIAGLLNVTEKAAAAYISYYWGGAMIGRFVGAYLQTKIKPSKLLAFNAAVVVVLVTISMTSSGEMAVWSMLLVGLFNSIMFPTIFTLATRGLGEHTSQGSGILCAAIVGGALVPLLQGSIADSIGIQSAFFIPIICYAYILFYAVKGYNPSLKI